MPSGPHGVGPAACPTCGAPATDSARASSTSRSGDAITPSEWRQAGWWTYIVLAGASAALISRLAVERELDRGWRRDGVSADAVHTAVYLAIAAAAGLAAAVHGVWAALARRPADRGFYGGVAIACAAIGLLFLVLCATIWLSDAICWGALAGVAALAGLAILWKATRARPR